jgi:hypothetical protein
MARRPTGRFNAECVPKRAALDEAVQVKAHSQAVCKAFTSAASKRVPEQTVLDGPTEAHGILPMRA